MKYRTSLIALALLALAFAGCSKHSPDASVAVPKVYDLGVVEVSDGIQSRHDLGGAKSLHYFTSHPKRRQRLVIHES